VISPSRLPCRKLLRGRSITSPQHRHRQGAACSKESCCREPASEVVTVQRHPEREIESSRDHPRPGLTSVWIPHPTGPEAASRARTPHGGYRTVHKPAGDHRIIGRDSLRDSSTSSGCALRVIAKEAGPQLKKSRGRCGKPSRPCPSQKRAKIEHALQAPAAFMSVEVLADRQKVRRRSVPGGRQIALPRPLRPMKGPKQPVCLRGEHRRVGHCAEYQSEVRLLRHEALSTQPWVAAGGLSRTSNPRSTPLTPIHRWARKEFLELLHHPELGGRIVEQCP